MKSIEHNQKRGLSMRIIYMSTKLGRFNGDSNSEAIDLHHELMELSLEELLGVHKTMKEGFSARFPGDDLEALERVIRAALPQDEDRTI